MPLQKLAIRIWPLPTVGQSFLQANFSGAIGLFQWALPLFVFLASSSTEIMLFFVAYTRVFRRIISLSGGDSFIRYWSFVHTGVFPSVKILFGGHCLHIVQCWLLECTGVFQWGIKPWFLLCWPHSPVVSAWRHQIIPVLHSSFILLSFFASFHLGRFHLVPWTSCNLLVSLTRLLVSFSWGVDDSDLHIDQVQVHLTSIWTFFVY